MSACADATTTTVTLATPTGSDATGVGVAPTAPKLLLTSTGAAPALHKVPTTSVITVVNATGPLTFVKTAGAAPVAVAAATPTPHFTLVNSAPLNVCHAAGKPITVVGAPPITVVRAISAGAAPGSGVEAEATTCGSVVATNGGGAMMANDLAEAKGVHTVYSVNNNNNNGGGDGLGAVETKFPSNNNILQGIITKNGQKPVTTTTTTPTTNNKLKILSNVLLPVTNNNNALGLAATANTAIAAINTNVLVNKQPLMSPIKTAFIHQQQQQQQQQQPSLPPPKTQNGTPRPAHNKFTHTATMPASKPLPYAHHKGQLRAPPPASLPLPSPASFAPPKAGIKTIPPQTKVIPYLRSTPSGGLRTIPPQRSKVPPNKPNYIGKHAIQGQKLNRTGAGRVKSVRAPIPSASSLFPHRSPPNAGVSYHQALTENIIQSLSENNYGNNGNCSGGGGGGGGLGGYVGAVHAGEQRGNSGENESASYVGLVTLPPLPPGANSANEYDATASLICQAIQLDHNYTAKPPTDAPRSPTSTSGSVASMPMQMNGTPLHSASYYSPPISTKSRSLSASSTTLSTLTSISTNSLIPAMNNMGNVHHHHAHHHPQQQQHPLHHHHQQQQQHHHHHHHHHHAHHEDDDDAASDISCGSERKNETEGEETDTAPEAEAVNNDSYDYEDYTTRCICGFLHDDGYMIECDRCKVWQHVRCVIKANRKVPDDYLCDMCDPMKPIDRGKARALQQQWMRENQERDAKLRKEAKLKEMKQQKENISDTETSDEEPPMGGKGGRASLAGRRKSDQQRPNVRQRRELSRTEPTARKPVKRKERKPTKRKVKVQLKSLSEDESLDAWSNPSLTQMPQLRQWIENYEEAVTNHYSPELRARISNIRVNGAAQQQQQQHHADVELLLLSPQVDDAVHKCRVHTQPLTGLKYLVSTLHLAAGTPVVELRGKYMLSTQHRNNAGGHGSALTTRQHSQRPGPFLFFYRLHRDNTEVCVDTRTYGNDARFIRRSCKPNAELRHSIAKGVLHLYIVTSAIVDKNVELTIKHESHDLAAVGTTQIACACGKLDTCTVNRNNMVACKKNGEFADIVANTRKRRCRRTTSMASEPEITAAPPKIKDETPDPLPPNTPTTTASHVKDEPSADVKPDVDATTTAPKHEEKVKAELDNDSGNNTESRSTPEKEIKEEEEEQRAATPPPAAAAAAAPQAATSQSMVTRKTTHQQQQHKTEPDEKRETPTKENNTTSSKGGGGGRKLSREERKLEAIMKAFERLEKQAQRKQEHQAKQAHRRESEPNPHVIAPTTPSKEEEKLDAKLKRKRRKGRARAASTHSQSRRNRLNSADSSYATSGDEGFLLSPVDGAIHNQSQILSNNDTNSSSKDAGLLVTLTDGDNLTSDIKSPIGEVDCNSNSANSSPETPLSSACLLVAAAVEPLEPNFKFPKTKKGLMNEWLNKSPECVQSASSISPSSLTPHNNMAAHTADLYFDNSSTGSLFTASKGLVALTQAANFCELPAQQQPQGNAKKRWLRQAISEDQCDSRPESPPLPENIAPPKKRRLPRESLSNENSPPTTPNASIKEEVKGGANRDERMDVDTENENESNSLEELTEPDAIIVKDNNSSDSLAPTDFSACVPLNSDVVRVSPQKELNVRCALDPRLARSLFNNSDHLVGTVEKTLSILGFEEKVEATTPTKRKLSITEYRQRKRLTVREKAAFDQQHSIIEENTCSQSPPPTLRLRSDSVSSAASFATTDDECSQPPPEKALSAFNSEPTELEKQTENAALRLKKALGLSIDEDSRKTVLSTDSLLNDELPMPTKSLLSLSSPTFPIPGSSSNSESAPLLLVASVAPSSASVATSSLPPLRAASAPASKDDAAADDNDANGVADDDDDDDEAVEGGEGGDDACAPQPLDANFKSNVTMFYRGDVDESHDVDAQEDGAHRAAAHNEYNVVDSTNYVPPFNNPLYPNSSFVGFGSVIDDSPYEGRNPSPPPELSVTSAASYVTP